MTLWQYADASARLIFGAEPIDPLPGLVLDKLKAAPDGLTRSQLHDAFQRNLPAAKLLGALAKLRDRGDIVAEVVRTTGRPAERWKAVRTNEESLSVPDQDTINSFNSFNSFTSFVRSPSPSKSNGGQVEEAINSFTSFVRSPSPGKTDDGPAEEVVIL